MWDPYIGFRLAVESEAELYNRHPKLKARLEQASEADIHRLFDEVVAKADSRNRLARYLREGNLVKVHQERDYVMTLVSSQFRCIVYFFPARFRTIVWARFADLVADAMKDAGLIPPKRDRAA